MPEMNRDEIAKLEALYASNPGGRVFTHLAEAYRKGGDYGRARAILEQGLTKHPGYASAYVVLGRVFLDLDDAAQATASFRRVLEMDPHNLVALRSLGDIARGAGRPTEALQYFEELSHQEPNNAEIEAIINELRHAPAESPPEVVETPVEPVAVEEPQIEAAPVEATAAPVMEEVSEPPATASSSSGFEEYVAPSEPAAGEFEEPEVQRAPEPESEPEPEMFSAYANAQPPVDFLPEIEVGDPDLTDLVAPDIDLDWGAGEPTQEALPGDLAEFAALSANNEADPIEPVAEEVPTFELPTFYVEEPPLAAPPTAAEMPAMEEPVAQEEPAEEVPPAESAPAPPVLTETMANLYREQGLYDQAADVYRSLLQDRPYDSELQGKLDEVESLAAPEAPPAFEGLPDDVVEEPMPFLGTAPEAPEDLGMQDVEVESPWMSAASRSASPPTPYAWAAETQASEGDDGPAISDYFQSLLSWRPATKSNGAAAVAPEPEPEVSSFEPTPAPLEEPPLLDLTASEIVMPPATPADSAMPWEEPVSPSTPVAPIAPPPLPPQRPAARSNDNPVEAAFEEWFSGDPETEPVAPPPSAAPAAGQPQAPTPPLMPLSSEGDGDDDDLEMFRSWLQSLKK
jgi:tetratricopeptide (TPR) repeat protein